MLLTGLTITFLKEFGLGLWLSLPLSLSLATTVALLGLVIGRKEGVVALRQRLLVVHHCDYCRLR